MDLLLAVGLRIGYFVKYRHTQSPQMLIKKDKFEKWEQRNNSDVLATI
jgi:hypothetical protein